MGAEGRSITNAGDAELKALIDVAQERVFLVAPGVSEVTSTSNVSSKKPRVTLKFVSSTVPKAPSILSAPGVGVVMYISTAFGMPVTNCKPYDISCSCSRIRSSSGSGSGNGRVMVP